MGLLGFIGVRASSEDSFARVTAAVDKAKFRNLFHAAASISKDVKSTLEKSLGPSVPGSPPHTHRGVFLRRAIRYQANKQGAIIGPLASVVGDAGHAHEFGGKYRGTTYPERPFMRPALNRAIPRFAGSWRGSVGG